MSMSSPAISPGTFYQLTSNLTGANLGIDHASGANLLLKLDAGYSYWQFLPIWGQDLPKYHICTQQCMFFYCLGIFASREKNTPHLATPDYDTGQLWTVRLSSNSSVKLSNDYSGSSYSLDLQSKGPGVIMTEGDYDGQHWTLNVVAPQGACTQSRFVTRGVRDIFEHGSFGLIGNPTISNEIIPLTRASKKALPDNASAVITLILLSILLIQGIWLCILSRRRKPSKAGFPLS